ncbi:Uncharacterised protein [Mycobacteroides abscessus subsp. abscessus]|nr:Uncharacterised protein [Mycobacteroides abscessus subsp. abscessus]
MVALKSPPTTAGPCWTSRTSRSLRISALQAGKFIGGGTGWTANTVTGPRCGWSIVAERFASRNPSSFRVSRW